MIQFSYATHVNDFAFGAWFYHPGRFDFVLGFFSIQLYFGPGSVKAVEYDQALGVQAGYDINGEGLYATAGRGRR